MSGDVHVRFYEGLRVRLPQATHRNIYVKSKRTGGRVMQSLNRFITQKLKLKVNTRKSAVARAWERQFLGFTFTAGGKKTKRRIAAKALAKFKQRVRELAVSHEA